MLEFEESAAAQRPLASDTPPASLGSPFSRERWLDLV